MKNRGSGTILVFSLISLIGLLTMLFSRNTALFHTFAYERMRYAQHQLALNALTEYAIALCCSKKIENSWSTTFDHWPDEKGSFLGKIDIARQGEYLHITAQLKSHGTLLGKIISRVKHINGKYMIIDWIVHESG